jgi:hypothetical protein
MMIRYVDQGPLALQLELTMERLSRVQRQLRGARPVAAAAACPQPLAVRVVCPLNSKLCT